MDTLRKGLMPVVLTISGALADDAFAQRGVRTLPNRPQAARPTIAGLNRPLPGVSPFAQVGPGLNLQQAAYNVMVMGRAFSFVPPYALPYAPPYALGYSPFQPTRPAVLTPWGPTAGYNPYLGAFVNPYPTYANPVFTAAANPYVSAYLNPYGLSNPYAFGGSVGMNASLPGTGTFSGSGSYSGSVPSGATRLSGQQGITAGLDNTLFGSSYGGSGSPFGSRGGEANAQAKADPLSSGLNDVMGRLTTLPARHAGGAQTPLDSKLLQQIRFVPDFQGAHAGLLRDLNKWPAALQAQEFQGVRQQLATILPQALKQAAGGQVSKSTLEKLGTTVDGLNTQLALNISNMDPLQYLDARRYTRRLDDLSGLLRQPDVSSLPKTVPQLVQFMKERGLQFAPAGEGERGAYERLQKILAAYGGGSGSK